MKAGRCCFNTKDRTSLIWRTRLTTTDETGNLDYSKTFQLVQESIGGKYIANNSFYEDLW